MTDDAKRQRIAERINALGVACPEAAAGKLLAYQRLLEDWNTRMNLTGDASFDALLDRHLLDCVTPLTQADLLPEGAAVIDVGSGAGLPGIPLAILRPDLRITLLDSLQKRVGFLQAVIHALALNQVDAVHARAEDTARETCLRGQFDIAMARAVATLPTLLELLLPFVKIGGKCIAFKGPTVDTELAAGRAAAALLGGGPPVVIPVSLPSLPEHRHCLVISDKRRQTPGQFPRKAGTPAKNPLGI